MTEHYDQREALHEHRHGDGVTKPEGTPELGRGEKPSSSPVVGDSGFQGFKAAFALGAKEYVEQEGSNVSKILEKLGRFSVKHLEGQEYMDGATWPDTLLDVDLFLHRLEQKINQLSGNSR